MKPAGITIAALGVAALCSLAAAAQEGQATGEADAAADAANQAGESDAGAALFARHCAVCHSLAKGKNGAGPSLFGILDKPAAMAPGFKYSRAMRQMAAKESLVWNEENLTLFIGRPSQLVPGTRMAFPGIAGEEDVAFLVEWIKANSGPPAAVE